MTRHALGVAIGSILLGGSLCMVGVNLLQAAPLSVKFNGNTYYMVNGNDPKMDTGNKVCASMGKKFVGFKSINTNSICKLYHPTAKEVISVNGSQAGFYCNGAPQQGAACAKFKNTCQVCPACNLNEAASGDQSIGQHFAEMYVWCADKTSSSKSSATSSPFKASLYGPLPLARSSSSSLPATGAISCTFSQKPLKKVTCGAVKAADTFCVLAMQSTSAKAVQCQDTGNVICTLPCSAPGASNLKTCAYGGVKVGSCLPATQSSSSAAKKAAGALCAHGGECQTGFCLGVVPGVEYRCSCKMLTYATSGC